MDTTVKRPRLFSLTELVVVIAIVSVLAAILFPLFTSVREKANQVGCASNLRLLGKAYAQYTHDNDGYFPGVERQDAGWAYPLYPYVKSYKPFQCPDDNNPPADSSQVHISYGQNSNFNDQIDADGSRVDFTSSGGHGVGMDKITSPSRTVEVFETASKIKGPNVFMDMMGFANNEGGSSTGNGYSEMWTARYATGILGARPGKDSQGNPTFTSSRHPNGSDFLAVDGHVAYLPGYRVSNGFTPASSKNPQGNYGPTGQWATAAGAGNMTSENGARFALTFSTK